MIKGERRIGRVKRHFACSMDDLCNQKIDILSVLPIVNFINRRLLGLKMNIDE